MNILITKKLIFQLGPQLSTQNCIFHFSSIHQKRADFVYFSPRKCSCTPKTQTFCYATASDSLGYGGWDHPQLSGKSIHSGESNLLQSFLISLGIDDKKYVFVYLLGFVCALAIFRVKVSSIIAFPVCAIVFAVGFSIGFVNGGHVSLSENKKRSKDEFPKEFIEKLRNLVDLLIGFDVKIVGLKDDIKKGMECNQITLDDLGGFVRTVESMNVSALNAKNVAEGCIESMLIENQEMVRTSNQKSSRRKKEVGENGFSFPQFVLNLFREKSSGSKPSKVKDSSKKESINMEVNDRKQGNILTSAVEERTSSSILHQYAKNFSGSFSRYTYDNHNKTRNKAENLIDGARRMDIVAKNENMRMAEMDDVLNNGGYGYQKGKFHYVNNQEFSWKIDHREGQTWASNDGLPDSVDFSESLEHRKTEVSVGQEKITEDLRGKYEDFSSLEETENKDYGSFIREQRNTPNSELFLADHESVIASDDMEFNRCLSEANVLLKQAKECLVQQGDDGVAENALYNSARLLLKAVNIRPRSLLAVGQLGNTYLLHGELKLRLSRELRVLLTRTDPILVDKRDEIDDEVARRDKIASVLVNVCEECEELLVKAGRKYRLALSIDGDDMRAMYNWGLALFFRAQLIADIGPGAACDADKVFLAAIDKFDAMMSRSNVYAPDALFRWGAALQQRSRLRQRNSKEKVKLLQQARRLYKDALDMDSNNIQVQNALSSCVSELKYWYD